MRSVYFQNPVAPVVTGGVWWIEEGELYPNDPKGGPFDPYPDNGSSLPLHTLGLGHLRIDDRVAVRFDLEATDEATLARTALLIENAGDRLADLAFYKEGWMHEKNLSSTEAARRIREVARFRGIPLARHTTICATDVVGHHGLLTDALDAWRASKSIDRFRETEAFHRSVIFSTGLGRMWFSEIGKGAPSVKVFGDRWRIEAIDRPADGSHEERHFDKRVACGYLAAFREAQPKQNTVLTSVKVDGVPTWIPYRRLILPFADGSIASVSEIAPASQVGIPFLRA